MSDALAHETNTALAAPWAGVALADLFASSCHLNPHAPAFGEAHFSSVAPARRLTYLQANEAVDRLSIALGGLGVPPGATIVLNLGGTIEAPLMVLAILRAGFVPCLAPVLLNRIEAAALLRASRAEAIVTTAVVGPLRPAETMRAAAVENGPRFILGFGARLPAGVVPLDDALTEAPETRVVRRDPPEGTRPLPLLTVERQKGGLALYRHDQEALVSASLALVLRAGIGSGERILSTLSPMSQAGLVTGLVPALLTGGALHHQSLFDSVSFLRLITEVSKPHLVVPAVMERPLAEAGVLAQGSISSTVFVHRPPSRFDRAGAGLPAAAPVVDVLTLGERALLMARRGPDGRPALGLGEIRVPDDDGALVLASRSDEDGLVSVAGPAVSTRLQEKFPDRETDWLPAGCEIATDADGMIVLATPAQNPRQAATRAP